jgi:hypothetical protein
MGAWLRYGVTGAGVVGLLLALLPWAAPVRAASTLTVTTLNDGAGSCTGAPPAITCTTLRGAIAAAADGDTIVFQSGLAGTLTLTDGELAINKSLTINGPGMGLLAISGSFTPAAARVFNIGPHTVTLADLTITQGFAAQGGGIFVQDGASLTLRNVRVTGGNSEQGGASTTTALSP